MRPVPEYVLGSVLAAAACCAGLLLATGGAGADLLRWLPPALLAALLGAMLVSAWQRRRAARASAGGLAWRAVLAAMAVYPGVLALYAAAIMAGTEHLPAASFAQLLLLLVVLGCMRMLWAVIPYSVFQYLLCRRYQRRTALPAQDRT
ncbi:hypothetical protein [Xanthomonas massiliensis]|uniref:hypothetical protein n=1 Tax=Xanthomonas massiliensis TaxID=1720302 RepID=UPI0008246464|nr:hypothetical protein [Xanthomonas massiliensis]